MRPAKSGMCAVDSGERRMVNSGTYEYERSREGEYPLPAVRVRRHTFAANGVSLAAIIYEPVRDSAGAVVLAHGYTGCKETMDVPAAYLCSRGWQCLTFDFRGHKLGGSSGAMVSAADAIDDMAAAVHEARKVFGIRAIAAVGHSMGGTAALVAASRDPDLVAIAALGTAGSVIRGFGSKAGESLMAQRGDYVIGAPASAILSQMGDLCASSLDVNDRPALFVAARGDVIVRPDQVRELAGRCGSSSEFVIVEGGHMDLPVRSRGFVAAWLDRVSDGWTESRNASSLQGL